MKNIKITDGIRKYGKLWLFGMGLSALIGLIHGVLIFYGII